MGPNLASIALLSLTSVASAEIKAKHFVKVDGTQAGDGEEIFGIAQTDAKAGDAFAVDVAGEFELIAPTPIAVGDKIQSDTEGRPIPLAGGAPIGIATRAAENPGDIVTILIR